MKKLPIILAIIILILCLNKQDKIVVPKEAIRFRVIANSDSESDQNLKYRVRDALIDYMNYISKDVSSKEEAIAIANKNIDEFYNIAKKVVFDNGFNYNINIEIGNFSFPTKTYGDISLPSGFYDALKVEIGEAKGQNWWCVMFPSLCFVDVSEGTVPEDSKADLQNNMQEEEYDLISSDTLEFKVKFKLVELFENAKIIMANKGYDSNPLF